MKKKNSTWLRNSNPVFKKAATHKVDTAAGSVTVWGSIYKTALLVFFTMASAAIVGFQLLKYLREAKHEVVLVLLQRVMPITSIVVFFLGIFIIYSPKRAQLLAPIYAILQGTCIGIASTIFNYYFPGIVLQAIALTFACFFSMLFFYRAGIITLTQKFKAVLCNITLCVLLYMLASGVYALFTGNTAGLFAVNNTSLLSIGFSVFMVGLSSLYFVIDFGEIEMARKAKVDKQLEWFLAFGCLVTFIWVYLECLKLLAKVYGRSRK